jgi:hypothetical protein
MTSGMGKCRQGRNPTQESCSLPSNQPSAEVRPARPPAPALRTCVLVVCKGEGLCQLAGQEGVKAQAGHHGCHDGGNALQQQGGAREGERKRAVKGRRCGGVGDGTKQVWRQAAGVAAAGGSLCQSLAVPHRTAHISKRYRAVPRKAYLLGVASNVMHELNIGGSGGVGLLVLGQVDAPLLQGGGGKERGGGNRAG